ncbi:PREDICTED: thioredoxin domain-containing protein 3 [Apaloderma vittatum]|uniref:thioredoxin domain-containing protein 3 n=1 Tax=Apaloderma vittatum TaxID=57397 RepID=UPI000521757B|nr:PREDICTED: thioredoxin domain-containing protein 3 [Apaloderma vittatum]
MAGKKEQDQLQDIITNENQWDEMLLTKGVVVIDVYQDWCGPCKAVQRLFRELKSKFSEDDVLHFAVAEANSIPVLRPFRDNCEPVFLFCVNGKIIAMVRGPDGPLLRRKIAELVEEERKIAAGQKKREEVDELVFVEEKTSEESDEETVPEVPVRYSAGIIKPDDVLEGHVEEIKQKIRDAGYVVEAAEVKMLTEEQIRVFYAQNKEQPDFDDFVQFMMSGPCHILVITKKEATDAIPYWKELSGSSESMPGETEAKKSDRQRCKHSLTCEMASQFYKDHKGKPIFEQLVNCMTDSALVVTVLTEENAVEEGRKLTGLTDPEVAKEVSLESIRAQFAQDILSNAVHGASNIENALESIECLFGELHIN